MHALDQFCAAHNIVHYLIDPGKPAQNGTVERSHREDQEKFYEQNGFKNLDDLERKLKVWNTYYNNLEHCGLGGKTPNEFLEDYKLIKPPNVLTFNPKIVDSASKKHRGQVTLLIQPFIIRFINTTYKFCIFP